MNTMETEIRLTVMREYEESMGINLKPLLFKKVEVHCSFHAMILFMNLCVSIQTCVNQGCDILILWTQKYTYLLQR